MLSKIARGFLLIFCAISLLVSGSFLTAHSTQASPLNAPILITGTLFTQPVDPAGKLILSSWLDPDGSDNDKYIWDNFTLQTSETITEINWIGGYDPLRFGGGGPVLDFRVRIFASIAAGTEPAIADPPLVDYLIGGNAGETSIGFIGSTPMYAYAFVLPASFAASAGVKYWVQIEAYQHGSIPDWGIAKGSGGDGSHYVRESGAGGDIRYHAAPNDAAFTLLGPIPAKPTDILLSNNTVEENLPVNTIVGVLTAAHPDPNAVMSFSLTCANAGLDDASFNISGSNLQTSASFDYETKNLYDICIRVTDQEGQTFDERFSITVINVNELVNFIYLPVIITPNLSQ